MEGREDEPSGGALTEAATAAHAEAGDSSGARLAALRSANCPARMARAGAGAGVAAPLTPPSSFAAAAKYLNMLLNIGINIQKIKT